MAVQESTEQLSVVKNGVKEGVPKVVRELASIPIAGQLVLAWIPSPEGSSLRWSLEIPAASVQELTRGMTKACIEAAHETLSRSR